MIRPVTLLKTKPANFLKNLIFSLWLKDARYKLERIRKYLAHDDRILDTGAGAGSVCSLLNAEGYSVTPLDVKDRTLTEHVESVIYDRNTIPYTDKSFDTVLTLTVLHHTQKPLKILTQAKRDADSIVIIEDIYANKLQKCLTYIFDSLF